MVQGTFFIAFDHGICLRMAPTKDSDHLVQDQPNAIAAVYCIQFNMSADVNTTLTMPGAGLVFKQHCKTNRSRLLAFAELLCCTVPGVLMPVPAQPGSASGYQQPAGGAPVIHDGKATTHGDNEAPDANNAAPVGGNEGHLVDDPANDDCSAHSWTDVQLKP